jgi:serine/threonine protein phosphatase PrpC
MIKITCSSEGKIKEKNEDCYGYNDACFVVADGATDKSGKLYGGKTGGELVSNLVVNGCLTTALNGAELVNHINSKISDLYKQLKITEIIKDPKFRFTCSFVCVRLELEKITITYIGDVGFRINNTEVYLVKKQVDTNNSNERANYIKKTGDIEGARKHIEPLLIKQFDYQNNAENPLGYGVLDGTVTPNKFINKLTLDIKDLWSLEIFSDGYFAIPNEATINAWEKLHKQTELEDPDKYIKYRSTKSMDDRTVLIVNFK